MALTRMNASTTAEITKGVREYLDREQRTETFRKFFQKDFVYEFFDGMLRTQRPETLDRFVQYHSEEHILYLFGEIFPPPCLYEMWNAWDRKGRP